MYFLDKFKKLLLLLIIFLVGGMLITWGSDFFLEPRVASAQTGCSDHNVEGWAWSERVGWMSFSCENCDSDRDGVTDQGNYSQCPVGKNVYDYGVDIDGSTGEFSGYAWSEKVGWISFESFDVSGCPSGTCQPTISLDNGEVTGWARALAYGDGWDGWIHLSDTDYGIHAQSVNGSSHFYDWAAGWDDNDEEAVIGWSSFSHENCDSDLDGTTDTGNYSNCPVGATSTEYFVSTEIEINGPPSATYLSTSTVAWCPGPEGYVGLGWDYDDPEGDDQSEYRLWVDDGDGNPEVDATSSGTAQDGKRGSSNVNVATSTTPTTSDRDVAYGPLYDWKVKVKDTQGNWSDWSAISSFDTPDHAKPKPEFKPIPSNPVVNQTVELDPDPPENPSDTYGGSSISSYHWDIPSDASFVDGTDASSQYPHVQFSSTGNNTVILTITDTDTYQCSKSQNVYVTLPLPGWKEVKPE